MPVSKWIDGKLVPGTLTVVAKSGPVQVMRVDQSPMNPLNWCLELSCKHTMWVTSRKRPVRKSISCPKCSSGSAEVPHVD